MAESPWADFHLHSTCSDGADAPEEVAARVAAAGARAFALTDHDTTAGNPAAAAAAAAHGLICLHGTEISTQFERMEIHVIALGCREGDPALEAALARLRASRETRSTAIVEKLQRLGIDIAPQLAETGANEGGSTGRMHIAAALAAHGTVRRPQDAFDRLLNPGKPAFVPREKLPLAEALELVHAAGGLAFIAHPGLGHTTRKALPRLLLLPFDGIEAYHISHTPGRTEEFSQLARERGLLISGGSDCHGGIKGRRELGRVRLPWHAVEAILKRLNG